MSPTKTAATVAGMRPAQLRGNVTSTAVVQPGQVARNFTPLVQIEVRGPTKAKAEKASNSFANTVVGQVVPYITQRLKLLEAQIANDEQQLTEIATRIDAANEQQRIASADKGLSLAEKLLVSTNSNATVNAAEQRRGTVLQDLNSARQLHSLAENVELSRVVQPAVAVRASATSRRNAAVVGHLQGSCSGRSRRSWPIRGSAAGARPPPESTVGVVEGKRVAVVVPAFQEELLVADTISGIPDFVDLIVVVDDHWADATVENARATGGPRLEVIEHAENQGVGGAIATGYARCRELGIDVTCVMAGDNQMDPAELATLVAPVARGELDYAKANRLVSGEAWTLIPRSRYLGNAVLSLLTKIASGYWHVADSQAGYTALSLDALGRLDLDRLYRRYGFPNDVLST